MPPILAMPADATPANLTAILRESGALPGGEVVAVDRRANPAFNSQITHLQLTYSPDAPTNLPTHLVLKRNLDAAWAVRANAREVALYQFVATLPVDDLPMIVRPLAAMHDPATGRSQLLLPDLSATHGEPTERARVLALDGVPTAAQLDAVVDALAAFHAYWWEHPALGRAALPPDDALVTREGYDRFIAGIVAGWSAFASAEGKDFPNEQRARCEFAVSRLARTLGSFPGRARPLAAADHPLPQ